MADLALLYRRVDAFTILSRDRQGVDLVRHLVDASDLLGLAHPQFVCRTKAGTAVTLSLARATTEDDESPDEPGEADSTPRPTSARAVAGDGGEPTEPGALDPDCSAQLGQDFRSVVLGAAESSQVGQGTARA